MSSKNKEKLSATQVPNPQIVNAQALTPMEIEGLMTPQEKRRTAAILGCHEVTALKALLRGEKVAWDAAWKAVEEEILAKAGLLAKIEALKRELNCDEKRELNCDEKRELNCDEKRELNCDEKRELNYDEKRELNYDEKRELNCDEKRELNYDEKRELNYDEKRELNCDEKRELNCDEKRELNCEIAQELNATEVSA